jgi:hypothetical protein
LTGANAAFGFANAIRCNRFDSHAFEREHLSAPRRDRTEQMPLAHFHGFTV